MTGRMTFWFLDFLIFVLQYSHSVRRPLLKKKHTPKKNIHSGPRMGPRIGLCFLCFFLFGPVARPKKSVHRTGRKKNMYGLSMLPKRQEILSSDCFSLLFRSPRATVNLFPSSFRLVSLLVPSSWWVSSTAPRSVLLPAFKIFTSRSLLPQDIMAEEGQVPKIPMNQEALLSSSSDSSDEEYDDLVVHTNKNHGAPLDSDVASMATATESSFKNWFEDDRHVPPDDKIPYLMMMMTTLDDTFTLDAPPFNKEKKKKGWPCIGRSCTGVTPR